MIYVPEAQDVENKADAQDKDNKKDTKNIKNHQKEVESIINSSSNTIQAISGPSEEGNLYFIDFGLGFESAKIEDKAVDLHLIKQALEAKHFQHAGEFFKHVLEGYKTSKNYKETIKRLELVEKRGRYKQTG
jgi:Kae1-associated kinase Bud32